MVHPSFDYIREMILTSESKADFGGRYAQKKAHLVRCHDNTYNSF